MKESKVQKLDFPQFNPFLLKNCLILSLPFPLISGPWVKQVFLKSKSRNLLDVSLDCSKFTQKPLNAHVNLDDILKMESPVIKVSLTR